MEYNTKLQTQLFGYVCGIQFIYFFGKIKILYYIILRQKRGPNSSLEFGKEQRCLQAPQQTRLWAK